MAAWTILLYLLVPVSSIPAQPRHRPPRAGRPLPLALRGGAKQSSLQLVPSTFNVPNAVDAAIAGLGLAGTFAVMGALQARLGKPLFMPPMMASGIIFFASIQGPPSPRGFLSGTLGCMTVSAATLAMLQGRVSAITQQGAAAGALLFWYRMTACSFPPAAALVVALAPMVSVERAVPALGPSLQLLAFPWLAGHACLYASACAIGSARSAARLAITKAELQRGLKGLSVAELRPIFRQFDTSNDGSLDASELKCALRVAVGAELTLSEVQKLIHAYDKDGDGVVDFGEFSAICKEKAD